MTKLVTVLLVGAALGMAVILMVGNPPEQAISDADYSQPHNEALPIIKTASQAPVSMPRVTEKPVSRCVNMGGALDAPREGDWGYVIREQDLRLIRQTGFDTIRLPVNWANYTQRHAPYGIDPALFARVDQVIEQAFDSGLKVILNVHNYDDLMENPDRHIPRLHAIWDQLAAHYARYPDSLIFELINEPHGKMTITKTNDLNAELLARVRRTHPDRWVVLGSGNWNSLEGLGPNAPEKFTPPRDPKIITTFHYYDDMNFTHQGAHFMTPEIPTGMRFGTDKQKMAIAKDFDLARAFQSRTGHPLLLGEFGVFRQVPDDQRAAWTRFVRQQAERHDMGWCYWEWATEFKLYNPQTGQFVPGLKDALFQ